jgi:hypothetical protein
VNLPLDNADQTRFVHDYPFWHEWLAASLFPSVLHPGSDVQTHTTDQLQVRSHQECDRPTGGETVVLACLAAKRHINLLIYR